jgi:hypothetical protein
MHFLSLTGFLYIVCSSCSMLHYFDYVLSSLLDQYLPLRLITKHMSEKPWVTEHFRSLIRQRQYAGQHGDISNYKHFRNRVLRLSKKLRSNYYGRPVLALKTSGSRNWWFEVKRFTGYSHTSPLVAMAANISNGDSSDLANIINNFFVAFPLTSTHYEM